MADALKFIVDSNAGKLTRWLRIMGYDTVFFNGADDSQMVTAALEEGRVILTRDTQIVKRRAAAAGRLRVILLESDEPLDQMEQVIESLKLDCHFRPFTICLECNQPLEAKIKEEVKDRVPPYIFKTQDQYVECPSCHRIYWRGTHWTAMSGTLNEFTRCIERKER